MIKLTDMKAELDGKAVISAFADDKSDVTDGMTIDGLPADIEPTFGSSIITASGDIAFLKSDGTWNWVTGG